MRIAILLLAAAVSLLGCSQRPVQTVTIGGEPWTVYRGSDDGMRGLRAKKEPGVRAATPDRARLDLWRRCQSPKRSATLL